MKRHRTILFAIVALTLFVTAAGTYYPSWLTQRTSAKISKAAPKVRPPAGVRSRVADGLNLKGRLKLEGDGNSDVRGADREGVETELFVNPPAPLERATATARSSATLSVTPNNGNTKDPGGTQEGSVQSKGQTVQARGEGDKVSQKPKEERLTMAHPFNGDLRNLSRRKPVPRERNEPEEPEPHPVFAPGTAETAPSGPSTPAIGGPSAPAPPPLSVFEGLDRFNWGAGSPPDTNGDVGPNDYIQTVNTSIGIFRKSDGFQEAAFSFDTFMSQGSFGNLCDTNNFGDPVVVYDTFEDRWIISDFAFVLDGGGNVVAPSYQCIAASKTGNPVTGGWNFYSIQVTDGYNDYPKFGIWPDGLYMSANIFTFGAGSGFKTARAWAFNKAQMYAGSPTVKVVSFDIPGGDFAVMPSNARLQTGTPPAGRPNLFLSTELFLNALTVYKFHVDWNSISLSTFTGPDVPIAGTSWPNAAVGNAAQPGTATLLDVLQIRAMVQNQYTNFGGTESLWVPHTVRRANTSGLAAPRWYQVNVTGGTVAASLPQATTWDPDAANVINRFMPSLALDRAGNMAMGYSTSNGTVFPSIMYAGRLAADPVNTFSKTEQTFFTGTASQTGTTRWGDYSAMTLDPDGCTFWYTNEYANPADQTFNHRWLTKFGSFRYAECTQVGAGGTVSGTVTTNPGGSPIVGATVDLGARSTTTDGSGIYSFTSIPAGTYPSITASFPGAVSASASSIVVTDGGTTTQDFSLAAAPASACLTDTTQSDFLTGVSTNLDLTTSPGDVTLLDAPSVDQQNTTLGTSGVGITTTTWGGQTFTPSVTGQLGKADINLFCSGCTGTTPNLTLSVRATSGGLPTGADIASTTITGFSNGAAVFYTGTFGSPPTLTAGTQYALVIRPTANPAPGTYALTRSGTSTLGANVYAGGTRVSGATSGTVWSIPLTGGVSTDAGFRIYLESGFATSGNLISGIKDANPAVGFTPIWSTFSWNATVPANTSLKFQLAGSNSVNGPFNFVGPDGTAATFFTTSPVQLSPQFYNFRFLEYKAFFATTDSAVTPTLNDATACFNDVDCSTTVATITPAPAQVCANTTGNTASGPAGMTAYAWGITNGSITSATNTQSITYTAGASGTVTLSLTVTSPNGCIVVNSAPVTINPIPATPTITPGGPTTFCAGGSVLLSSSSASGNQWFLNGNPIGGATNQTYSATASGSYTVVTTASGCSSAASAATVVTVNPIPATPTITPGGPTTFCAGGSVTLTSSRASGNQWYLNGNPIGGATNQAYIATAAGDYTDIVTTSGCASAPSAATTVTVNPIPATPTITPGGPTTFSAGGSVTLTSSSAGGNQWYLNGNPIGGATNQNYVAAASGDYTVTVTTLGCTSTPSAAVTVTVIPFFPPTISKLFLPDTVAANGTTLLSFTISNPNSDPNTNITLNGIAFTDNLPAGLVIASPNDLTNDCGGTVAATPGSSSISLSGGTLAPAAPNSLAAKLRTQASSDPAAGTCFITVKVKAPGALGTLNNTTGTITANETGPGVTSNTASLTVIAPPAIAKGFGAASIPLNGTTSLTFLFTNPNSNVTFMNVSASDILPTGLVVASPNNLAGSCAADITANPGSNTIGITALNLPASSSCSFSVNVTGTSAGIKDNTSGNVTAFYDGGTGDLVSILGGSATATIQVLKGDQTITFGALTNRSFGDPDFSVSATTTSALTPGFSASGQCTMTGIIVHLTGAGSCTITASQGGDGNYNPAANVVQSFNIAQAATVTALSSSVNPSDIGQNVTFTATITPPSTTSTPTGTVQFKDGVNNLGSALNCVAGGGNTCTAQISISTLTTGAHAISAIYSGDTNFTGSSGLLSGGQVVTSQPALLLILDESGPDPNQAAALDSLLLLRDPFPVHSVASWWTFGPDRNTRVMVFVANLQLSPGETASAVVVNLIDSNSQSYDVTADDMRLDPISGFAQVTFRLPDTLSLGACTVKVKAHGQASNSAIIRIGP
jgi:hypothetical protein